MIALIENETAQGNALGGRPFTLSKPIEVKEQPQLPAYDLNEIDEMLGGKHFFPRELAKAYGVREAVVIRFLSYKVRTSSKKKNGKIWHYDAVEALANRYPYIPRSTMYDVLKRLEKAKLIETGRFNKHSYDRTGWYTVPLQVMDMAEKKLIRFNVLVAKEFGIPHAVLYRNLIHRVAKNTSQTDPQPYVHMPPTILAESLPFGVSTIKSALNDLVKAWRIIKHPEKGAYYALPYRINVGNIDNNDDGQNPDMDGRNPDMGSQNPDDKGQNPDERGRNPDNNTHYKTIIKTITKAVEKEPFKKPAEPDECANSPEKLKRETITEPSDSEKGEAHNTDDETVKLYSSEAAPRKSIDLNNDESQEGDNASSASAMGYAPNTDDGELNPKYTYDEIHSKNYQLSGKLEKHPYLISGINDLCFLIIKEMEIKEVLRLAEFTDPDALIPELEPLIKKTLLKVQPGCRFEYYMKTPEMSRFVTFASLEFLIKTLLKINDTRCEVIVHSINEIGNAPYKLILTLVAPISEYRQAEYYKNWEEENQKLLKEQAKRRLEFKSVDEAKERVSNLAPAEKVRGFRNAINTANKVGLITNKHEVFIDGLIQTGVALAQAEKLFELNRELTVADLMTLLLECWRVAVEEPAGEGYDNKYKTRNGTHLTYFIKFLADIIEEQNGNLPDALQFVNTLPRVNDKSKE